MLSFTSRGGSASSKSTKVAPFSGVPSKKIPDAQQQVQHLAEELKKEREEKSKVVEELTQLKIKSNSQINVFDANKTIEMLEKQVEKAKQSERNMQESLVVQTKLLEQTKMRLTEAKLEIQKNRNRGHFEKNGNEGEIRALKTELKLAIEAEENANDAMNDLALLLKEVNDELSTQKRELEKTKTEADENALAWNEKEQSILNCVKESTDENNLLKQENTKLFESQKVIRAENSKLRENLKKSLEEINSLKEELEAINLENNRLNNLLTDKDDALQNMKLDYESLKVIEAATQRSLKELNRMLGFETAMPKNVMSPYSYASNNGNISPNDFTYIHNGKDVSPKDYSLASLSNCSEMKAASFAVTEEFDRDSMASFDGSVTGKKKRRNVLAKFGSIFKGKSFKPIPPLPPMAPRPTFTPRASFNA